MKRIPLEDSFVRLQDDGGRGHLVDRRRRLGSRKCESKNNLKKLTDEHQSAFLCLPLHAGERLIKFGSYSTDTVSVGLVENGITSIGCCIERT